PEPDSSVIAVRHELADGNHLEAAAWSIGEREILVAYVFERPVHMERLVVHSEALHLAVEGREVRLLARSVNGRPTAGTRAGDGSAVQPMSHCAGCSGDCWIGPYEIDCQSCAELDWLCVANCCVWACGGFCYACARGDIAACGICMACVAVWCPFCSSHCCRRWVHDCCACGPCPGP
ncbi:MAG: hypothetical protein ACK4OK_09975, partial [Thermoflexus sp.]